MSNPITTATAAPSSSVVPPDPKIIDLITKPTPKPYVSVEFFPPRSEEAVQSLYQRMDRMKSSVQPLFTDVTWGAGGSTATLTMQLCQYAHTHGHVANLHLTCTNMAHITVSPVEAIHQALQEAYDSGIRNIVALRGDPPLGQTEWKAVEGGFTCALDLVTYIRSLPEPLGSAFGIAVAGYPEGHPNAITEIDDPTTLTPSELARSSIFHGKCYCCKDDDYQKELDYLQRKVTAGADFIITQMFFDIHVYEQFVQDCRDRGITVPIVPGIMCITTHGGFGRMTQFCKTRVPTSLQQHMDTQLKDATDAQVRAFGIEFGTNLCQQLIERCHVTVLHFYTLNLEKVVTGILNNLQLLPTTTTTTTTDDIMDADAALMVAKGSAWARVGDEVSSIFFTKGLVQEIRPDTGLTVIVVHSWRLANGQHPMAYLQPGAYQKVF